MYYKIYLIHNAYMDAILASSSKPKISYGFSKYLHLIRFITHFFVIFTLSSCVRHFSETNMMYINTSTSYA